MIKFASDGKRSVRFSRHYENKTYIGDEKMSITENKSLWTKRECALRLGISERTLHSHTVPRGELPCVKIGVRVGYRPEAVEAWLRSREIEVNKSTGDNE